MRAGDAPLEEFYAGPDLLERRLVLADRLQELGDPRGTFIALQCARAGTAKRPTRLEQSLLSEHRCTWLEDIERHVHSATAGFEGGFLARCKLRATVVGACSSRVWRTVEHLDASHHGAVGPYAPQGGGAAPLLRAGSLRSLRSVVGCGDRDVEELSSMKDPPALTTLGLEAWDLSGKGAKDLRWLARFGEVQSLRVREAAVHHGERYGITPDVFRDALPSSVRDLRVWGTRVLLGAFVDFSRSNGLSQIVVRPGGREATFTYRVSEAFLVIDVTDPHIAHRGIDLESHLGSLQSNDIRRVVLRRSGSARGGATEGMAHLENRLWALFGAVDLSINVSTTAKPIDTFADD